MSVSRVRFTVLGMMVAIAIIALLLEIEVLRQRRTGFLIMAEKCNAQAYVYRAKAEQHKRLFARRPEVEHSPGCRTEGASCSLLRENGTEISIRRNTSLA
jgi:hypothetical protein